MENKRSPDAPQSLDGLSSTPENGGVTGVSQESAALDSTSQPIAQDFEYDFLSQKRKLGARLRLGAIILVAVLLLAGAILWLTQRGGATTKVQAGSFGVVRIPLGDITSSSLETAESLKVNGRLQANSLVLTPTSRPTDPLTGQLYYDQTTNGLFYYDGTQFLALQGTTNLTTNNFGGAGGLGGTGTPGTIAMFTGANTLGNSFITQTGQTLNVGNRTTTTNVNLGSASGSSATLLQAGGGNLQLATGSGAGTSGSISINTGNSSTTASGNITIDTGSGIVDGEVVEDKTFEGGLDSMTSWFGSTIAQTTAQAHSGVTSLEATATDPFWGVIEVLPGTSVIPGHQYLFSIWVRAASAPRTINATVQWEGTGGQALTLTPVVDSTTGWTEISGLAAAPATATSAAFRISSAGAIIGEIHYFDDITITDLSSASAISAISIGAANAKIVTIGNLTQIGATSIFGSSGISLNSGAAATTINGGVINVTGNAASSLATTTGALTLTSAASATSGVGIANSGVGGDLTVRGGAGGADDNNDGGNLILQGGARNGTGTAGSVIVRPPTDVTDTFQIQNSTGTPLFIADTSGMNISVTGTDTTYATLTVNNGHFRSTQTTAPTIGTPVNCGTTPTATVTTGSTDSAGAFTITTGTGGTSSTCDAVITFHRPYTTAPKSILVVGKTDAASVLRQIYVVSANTTTFTVSFATSAGGANSTAYNFNYWLIE